MTSKLTKIVLTLALITSVMSAAGCDERDLGRSRGGSGSDAWFNFDLFGSDCCGYETVDEYYVEETYVEETYIETDYYDGYDVYPDDGSYYGDDWKGKKPG